MPHKPITIKLQSGDATVISTQRSGWVRYRYGTLTTADGTLINIAMEWNKAIMDYCTLHNDGALLWLLENQDYPLDADGAPVTSAYSIVRILWDALNRSAEKHP